MNNRDKIRLIRSGFKSTSKSSRIACDHQLRAHYARGLCRQCYEKLRRKGEQQQRQAQIEEESAGSDMGGVHEAMNIEDAGDSALNIIQSSLDESESESQEEDQQQRDQKQQVEMGLQMKEVQMNFGETQNHLLPPNNKVQEGTLNNIEQHIAHNKEQIVQSECEFHSSAYVTPQCQQVHSDDENVNQPKSSQSVLQIDAEDDLPKLERHQTSAMAMKCTHAAKKTYFVTVCHACLLRIYTTSQETGISVQARIRLNNKRSIVTCPHPEAGHCARGLCGNCYRKFNMRENKQRKGLSTNRVGRGRGRGKGGQSFLDDQENNDQKLRKVFDEDDYQFGKQQDDPAFDAEDKRNKRAEVQSEDQEQSQKQNQDQLSDSSVSSSSLNLKKVARPRGPRRIQHNICGHPQQKHYALGMCSRCYVRYQYKKRQYKKRKRDLSTKRIQKQRLKRQRVIDKHS